MRFAYSQSGLIIHDENTVVLQGDPSRRRLHQWPRATPLLVDMM